MKRRASVGGAFAGRSLMRAYAKPATKAGDVPTRLFRKAGAKVPIAAQVANG